MSESGKSGAQVQAKIGTVVRLVRLSPHADTVYAEIAAILMSAIRALPPTSRSEEAARFAFSQIISLLLAFRRLWTVGDFAERFGVAQSTINKWRTGETAPREFMRIAIMRDISAWLSDDFEREVEAVEPLAVPAHESIARAAVYEIARRLRSRLALPTAFGHREFSYNLRALLELDGWFKLDDIADATGVAPSTISRWSTSETTPASVARRTVVPCLIELLDSKLQTEAVQNAIKLST